MVYDFDKAYTILERTPRVLKELLSELDDEWIYNNEGPDTFSPFDVVGHLLHGERTDWITRTKVILEFGAEKAFTPYDRFAQYRESEGKNIDQLLTAFEEERNNNLDWLKSIHLNQADLDKQGQHPSLGTVTLRNLLSTWVVHDLTHIAQITRVMAKQYKTEIGPWVEFFRILNY